MERELGTVRRSALQSQCSHDAWRRPDCRCRAAREGHLPEWGAWMLRDVRRGGVEGAAQLHWGVSGAGARPAFLCKLGLAGGMHARCGRWRRAVGFPAAAGEGETCGKRRLRRVGARLPPAGRQTGLLRERSGAPRATWLRLVEPSPPPASFSTEPAKPEPDSRGLDSVYHFQS